MKKGFIIAIILCFAFLCGCVAQPVSAPEMQADSGIPGYYSSGQATQGGKAQGGSLRSISIARQQAEYLLTLEFEGELPAYTLDCLNSPSRLRFSGQGIEPAFAGQDHESLGLFQGLFYEEGESGLELYFQFFGNIAFKAKEGENSLTLQVRADDMQEGLSYYVRLPYTQEARPFALQHGFTPALCDDLVSFTYISAPFASMEEADALRLTLEGELKAQDLDATAMIVPMENGQNPPFMAPISREALNMLGAMEDESGGVVEAQVFALDARFLCWLDEKSAVMTRGKDQQTGESGQAIEEVWLYNIDGTRELLLDGEFSALQKAAVSPDGRYLALVEQLDAMRLLYVYDLQESDLELLSTQGFGDYTADFAWAENGKLYAMTGDDLMQLMVYDPQLAGSEQSAVSGVEEREGSYASVYCAGGYIYFGDDYGDIMRVDTETAVRELVTSGDGYMVSPDGRYMAVIGYEEVSEEALMTLMTVQPLDGSWEPRQVSSTETLGAMCWSVDGGTLYYLVDNKGDATYPVTLHAYNVETGENKTLGKLTSNSIFASCKDGEIMMMAYYTKDGAYWPVTYRLELP